MNTSIHNAALLVCLVAAFAGTVAEGQMARPRIAPVAETAWTEAQRAAAAQFAPGGSIGNDLRTWLNHPPLVAGVMPFVRYISEQSGLTPRHRELLILRTAWLSRSEYVWAHHAAAARKAGMSSDEIRRVAEGPQSAGWSALEGALLRAADELHENSFINDAIWKVLTSHYDTPRVIDAVFTVTEFTMLAGAYNSIGVQLEPGITNRLPDMPVALNVPQREPPLTTARVTPLEASEWTPEVRAMLDPQGSGRTPIAIYRTIARNPKLYPPRQLLSEYIRLHATLAARERELLILRMGWLARSEYEWAQHVRQGRNAGLDTVKIAIGPTAPGWSDIDVALLKATDELYYDDKISDATWNTLATRFSPQELMDALITAGGYRMVSMALNTLGVQLEPGNERFPVIRN
jgi:alkylhydroperoxidase family enzyme